MTCWRAIPRAHEFHRLTPARLAECDVIYVAPDVPTGRCGGQRSYCARSVASTRVLRGSRAGYLSWWS